MIHNSLLRKAFLLAFLLFGLIITLHPGLVSADDCDTSKVSEMNLDQINDLLAKCERARQMSVDATKPLEGTLGKLELDLKNIQARVSQIETDLKNKEKKIKAAESNLADQEEILEKRVRQFYIRSHYNFPFLVFLSQTTASDLTRELAYRQAVTADDKRVITQTVLEIKDLEAKKENLKNEKVRLAQVQTGIDQQASFLKKEIQGAKAYQARVSTDIAGVTTRQQQLLAEKYGSFSTSVGDVECEMDNPQNPFSPAYAAYSFGAPHRVGMSQYGAFGRAKAGQGAEQILKAYFSGVDIRKDYPVPDTIVVDGYGRISFEDLYLKGIGEMPSSWGDRGGMEALKAQAIAARTYALAATNNAQSSICPTESCQVFIGSNKGGKWEEAVAATRGWVIVKDGQPIKAWYASTAGGFTRSSGDVWGKATSYTLGIADTSCGGSSCWPGDAYEAPKYGNSCWFHKAWYRPYRSSSSSRSHPWLTEEEMADIVNAALLYQADNGTISHLSQTDKGNGDTWSREKIREELRNRGQTPVSNIQSVPDSQYSTAGYTARVSFNIDGGNKSFDGGLFKQIFNLRAPGEIHIASSLYNLEKR